MMMMKSTATSRHQPITPSCDGFSSFKRLMEDSREMSRRSFLAITGWVGFSVASAIALYQSLKFRLPERDLRGPAGFKADAPTTYAVGSTTVLIDKRVVINHDPNGFYAISLICTHLAAPPATSTTSQRPGQCRHLDLQGSRYRPGGDQANPALPGFKCPCHGSRYFRDAINFFGPAPRPMDRVHVEVAPDGKTLDRPLRYRRSRVPPESLIS